VNPSIVKSWVSGYAYGRAIEAWSGIHQYIIDQAID